MSTVLTLVSFLLSLHTSDGPMAHLSSHHMPSFSLLLSILYTLARKKNLKCKHDHFLLKLSPDNFQIKFRIFSTEFFRGRDLPISLTAVQSPTSAHICMENHRLCCHQPAFYQQCALSPVHTHCSGWNVLLALITLIPSLGTLIQHHFLWETSVPPSFLPDSHLNWLLSH